MEDSMGSKSDEMEVETDKKLKPPNRKKFDEDMEVLLNTIKEKEAQHKCLIVPSIGTDLKSLRSEKMAVIDKLKKIDSDLRSWNQDIAKNKGGLDRLQSMLTYKSEDKIDDSIGRLEHQLKRQNFRLSEEKKIVAEIDSLKRSKKVLSQFLTLKREIDVMRDRQRRMREERDHYQRNVNRLRNDEDDLKKTSHDNKVKLEALKKEIDVLYESKRRKLSEFKALEKEFLENKEEIKKLKRRESFMKKKERRTTMEAFQKDIEEYGLHKEPYEDEINLCNTLVNYLQKFQISQEMDNVAGPVQDESAQKSAGWSVIRAAVMTNVTNELEDGKYVLLKKNEDTEYSGVGRRLSKRRPSQKGRKQFMTKPVTHTPQIFSQFASLNLNAPSTISEIPVSLEQLQARKKYYVDGINGAGLRVCTPTLEEHSDAGVSNSDGISATESAACAMSRQASNTESTENPAENSYHILDELVQVSNAEGMSETMSEKSEDTLGRSNSDSTEHGQSEGDCSDNSGGSVVKASSDCDKVPCDNCDYGVKRSSDEDIQENQETFVTEVESSSIPEQCDKGENPKVDELSKNAQVPSEYEHVNCDNSENCHICDLTNQSDVVSTGQEDSALCQSSHISSGKDNSMTPSFNCQGHMTIDDPDPSS